MIYTKKNDWAEFIQEMHSGNTLEVDGDIFDYFLGVLPPIFMNQTVNGQRYSFGFAEGEEPITGFWQENDRISGGVLFFCRDLGIMHYAYRGCTVKLA